MTKSQKKIYDWLLSKPGYLKKDLVTVIGVLPLNLLVGISDKKISEIFKQAKTDHKLGVKVINPVAGRHVGLKPKVKTKTKKVVIKAVEAKPLNTSEATELIESENLKLTKKVKFKRLFFDIETSPNIVSSWRVGYNINITPDNIIQERAIICICYKWAGESKVHSLTWDKGDDKQLLIDFMKVMNEADEIIGHNSDKFDEKWIRTRALYHGLDQFPRYQKVDTLKLAKENYLFNSNKLDYIGQFLGVGKKMETGGFGLWKAIFIDHDSKAMDKMVKYCKVDVIRLQQIFDKLNPFTKHKSHVGVALGKGKESCPNCGGVKTYNKGFRYLASGSKKHCRLCLSCGKGFTLPGVIKA